MALTLFQEFNEKTEADRPWARENLNRLIIVTERNIIRHKFRLRTICNSEALDIKFSLQCMLFAFTIWSDKFECFFFFLNTEPLEDEYKVASPDVIH